MLMRSAGRLWHPADHLPVPRLHPLDRDTEGASCLVSCIGPIPELQGGLYSAPHGLCFPIPEAVSAPSPSFPPLGTLRTKRQGCVRPRYPIAVILTLVVTI